jgi:DNA-binding protein HU-beta
LTENGPHATAAYGFFKGPNASSSFSLKSKGLTMNKNELIEHIAQEFEVPKTYARDIIDNVFDTIAASVQQGEEVSIFGFGKFKLVERKARKGRNPQTGEAIKIAASKNVKFEQAKAMKELVNTKRRGKK